MHVRVGPWRRLSAKSWCFWTVVLEKTLESPLDCKKIQPVNPKGNRLWIFIGRTDAEAEAPILWPLDVKSLLTGKDPDAGKDWRQEEKRATEDEMIGWHRWLNGHEFEQILGDSEGQGSLACCSPWGRRVRHDWASEHQQAAKYHMHHGLTEDYGTVPMGLQCSNSSYLSSTWQFTKGFFIRYFI